MNAPPFPKKPYRCKDDWPEVAPFLRYWLRDHPFVVTSPLDLSQLLSSSHVQTATQCLELGYFWEAHELLAVMAKEMKGWDRFMSAALMRATQWAASWYHRSLLREKPADHLKRRALEGWKNLLIKRPDLAALIRLMVGAVENKGKDSGVNDSSIFG
jgi:hypothetical protein